MTELLWIGYASGDNTPQTAPNHHRLSMPDGAALALSVDASAAESDDGILAWAEAQNAVLTAYCKGGDVVPVPLGAVFSTVGALVEHVTEQLDSVRAVAKAMSGQVEFALHVGAEPSVPRPQTKAHTGREYLVRRQLQHGGQRAVGKERRAALATLCDAAHAQAAKVRVLNRHGAERLLDLALLVHRHKIPNLLESLRAQASKASSLGMSCRLVGPGPAYSFALQKDHYD